MTGHDPLCPFSDTLGAPCMYCALIAKVRTDERLRMDTDDRLYATAVRLARADERKKIAQEDALNTAVIDAARAWVGRIVDPPNLWADKEDFALIEAVKALG